MTLTCSFLGTRTAIVICAGVLLSACTQSTLRIQPDFGSAVNQDLSAQIADPDAHYVGTPAPGSNGARVGLAQKRYQTNAVIPPSSITASGSSSVGHADNGSSGAPADAGASTGMAPPTIQ